MTTMKCAWCGAVLPLTPKGRPRQHKDGKTTCPGSGQQAQTHSRLRTAAEANAKARHSRKE